MSFNKNISKDLRQLIFPLINSKQFIDITKDVLLINELDDIYVLLTNEKIYRCLPFMINFLFISCKIEKILITID